MDHVGRPGSAVRRAVHENGRDAALAEQSEIWWFVGFIDWTAGRVDGSHIHYD
jgi:hypothetical protein